MTLTRKIRWRLKWAWSYIAVRPRVRFPSLHLQTNTVCQNRCKECITHHAMADHAGYQMTIEQVKALLQTLKQGRYWIAEVHLNGLGEPTLWKNFNEGIQLLGKSQNIGRISVVTNGKSLHLVDKKTCKYIHVFMLSAYPGPELDGITATLKAKGAPMMNMPRDKFYYLPRRHYPGTIPTKCICPGPMYLDGNIMLHCGAPNLYACKLAGATPNLVPCVNGWGENFQKHLQGNMPICEYCPANQRIIDQSESFTYENQKGVTA